MSSDRTGEMLNYLTAIIRDIGEFRRETKTRFDALEDRMTNMEERMGNLESDVKQIRRDMKLLRDDIHHTRLEHEETKERVAELESK